jgi:hypothetical protein
VRLAIVCFLALGLASGTAHAADTFDASTFRPSPHAGDLFAARAGAIAPHGSWTARLFVQHEGRPLSFVEDDGSGSYREPVLTDRLALQLTAAVALFEVVSVGVRVPVVLWSAGAPSERTGLAGTDGLERAGLGDIALSVKGALLEPDGDGIGLALDAEVTAPTHLGPAFAGEPGVSVSPLLIADIRLGDSYTAIHAGARLRSADGRFGDERINHELLLGVAFGIPMPGVAGLFSGAELALQTPLDAPFSGAPRTQIAARLGARYTFPMGLSVELGGGAGLEQGLSSGSMLFFLGVGYGLDADP